MSVNSFGVPLFSCSSLEEMDNIDGHRGDPDIVFSIEAFQKLAANLSYHDSAGLACGVAARLRRADSCFLAGRNN
ncbi:MAG: hypothetical protein WCA04_08750 [Geobacteraceae bacterium]